MVLQLLQHGAAIAPTIRNARQIAVNVIRNSELLQAENAELVAVKESG
jgi:hypothetical protein